MNKTLLKKKYGEEEIFVVPFEKLNNIPDGINEHSNKIIPKIECEGHFVKRYNAEGNPAFQQIIPYVVIYCKNTDRYFVAERINGDNRLIGKMSTGFGGHIDLTDISIGKSVILTGLNRELEEELVINTTGTLDFKATIRDVTSSTNDHTGLLYIYNVETENVEIKETDNLKGDWFTSKDLYDKYFKFEGWGKLTINYLLNK